MQQVFRSRPLQHFVFWGFSYYVLLTIFTINPPTRLIDHIYTLLFHISLLAAVYVNLSLLFPLLLEKRKPFLYALSLVGLWLGAALLNQFTFEVVADKVFPGYYFISYYTLWDILRFIAVYLVATSLMRFSRAWFELQAQRTRLANLEKDTISMEMKMLRSQVHPHFLFNTLNNIYGLIIKKDPASSGAILKLSDLLRYILYESPPGFTPLAREIDIIESFAELMQIRKDRRWDIRISVTDGLDDIQVPSLILLPLVENCFKHGGEDASGQAYIDLEICRKDKTLQVQLINSMPGGTSVSSANGIGTANVRRRLELLYGEDQKLELLAAAGTYKVKMILPIQDENHESEMPDR